MSSLAARYWNAPQIKAESAAADGRAGARRALPTSVLVQNMPCATTIRNQRCCHADFHCTIEVVRRPT